MFTIECLVDSGETGEQWRPEIQFSSEFRAVVNALAKCMATGKSYRILSPDHTVQCVLTLEDCKRFYGVDSGGR